MGLEMAKFSDTLPDDIKRRVKGENSQRAGGGFADEITRSQVIGAQQTANILGYSVVHFRRLYRSGLFPPPLRISARKCGWRVGDVIDFIEAKAREAA